jgi:hypothetical protein
LFCRIHVQLIDDISGEDAQETIRFFRRGTDYEIDLSAENAADFHATMEPHAAKSRRLRGPSSERAGRAVSMSRDETQKIRKWATDNGYNTNPRGRISQTIKQACDAA